MSTTVKKLNLVNLANLRALDLEQLREIIKSQGFESLACYKISAGQAIQFIDTSTDMKDHFPPIIDSFNYHYTSNSGNELVSGWLDFAPIIRPKNDGMRYWIYLPQQDLWSVKFAFLVTTPTERNFQAGSLDGFMEALTRRIHFWIAGDELRHFIDDSVGEQHLDSVKRLLNQMLSHEMRNPISNLFSLCHMNLLDDSEKNKNVEGHRNLMDEFLGIGDQILNCLTKFELILNSDAKSGLQSPYMNSNVHTSLQSTVEKVALTELIQKSISVEAVQRPALKTLVELNASKDLVWVQVVKDRIIIAIRELLKNAEDFGGGSKIVISVSLQAETAVIDFQDAGLEVPAGQEELIFLRYYQSGQNVPTSISAESPRRGLGLGLYLARLAVRMNGGDLIFVRGVGKKGVFRMMLPRSQA
ncbi:MAG: HAMP domain-containing sensor histidine kinase [Proteobacteria bacterium]|nr:HAMP domain-containing sensor histidine kinase [Pseudomonadota bacterium]